MISQTKREEIPFDLDAKPKGKDPFQFVTMRDVKPIGVHWVWEPYIPRGAVTLLAGDGGYGKSWLTCALAADLSSGRALPGQKALEPQKILMISAEDGLGQVIRPKLDMLGANMDNIRATDRGFTMDKDSMLHLIAGIKEYDAAIVFLDPLVVYMGGKVDMFRANETRGFTNLLVDVAKHTNTAIVAVHHVRKSGEGSIQNKVMGSADFVNGVRSTLIVDVSKGGQRYMIHAKTNWGKLGNSLAYTFGDAGFEWQGIYDGVAPGGHEVSTTARGEIKAWLRKELGAGQRTAHEMMKLATAQGYTERTLQRAKEGTVSTKNVEGTWVWRLTEKEMELMQKEEEKAQATIAEYSAPAQPSTVSPAQRAYEQAMEVMRKKNGK